MFFQKAIQVFLSAALMIPCAFAADFTVTEIRQTFRKHNVTALNPNDLHPDTRNPHIVNLGRMLFFDKILSGNKDISCASCHFPSKGTADNLPVSIGTGGQGLGEDRELATGHFIPRNAPAAFNMGYQSFHTTMWDGRISIAYKDSNIILNTPEVNINGPRPKAKKIHEQINSIAAAQALFPVTSFHEMRGQAGENEIADAQTNEEVWQRLMHRLNSNTKYIALFKKAFSPKRPKRHVTYNYGHVARAIGAFEMTMFRADDTHFDAFLKGHDGALTRAQKRGAALFIGKAKCISCHNGPHLTDFKSYSSGMPQLGPGKEPLAQEQDFGEDRGLLLITNKENDLYKFKTPTLRNTYHTGPWSHSGAYNNLQDFLYHHVNPRLGMTRFLANPDNYIADPRFVSLVDFDKKRNDKRVSSADKRLKALRLNRNEIKDIYEFLKSFSDLNFYQRFLIPKQVPSGLSVDP